MLRLAGAAAAAPTTALSVPVAAADGCSHAALPVSVTSTVSKHMSPMSVAQNCQTCVNAKFIDHAAFLNVTALTVA